MSTEAGSGSSDRGGRGSGPGSAEQGLTEAAYGTDRCANKIHITQHELGHLMHCAGLASKQALGLTFHFRAFSRPNRVAQDRSAVMLRV